MIEGLCENVVIKLTELSEIQSGMNDRMVMIDYKLMWTRFEADDWRRKWQSVSDRIA